MRLPYHSSLAKILTCALGFFLYSCGSTKNHQISSIEPILIPKERGWFDHYDEVHIRYIVQQVEFVDGRTLISLQSMWYMDFMPVEIVVLDDANLSEEGLFRFAKGDKLEFRRTSVYLPFSTVSQEKREDLQSLLPTCKNGGQRALARIASPMRYRGVQGTQSKSTRAWFVLGNVICIKKQESFSFFKNQE